MTDTQPFMDEALELRGRVLWESNSSIQHIATALSSAYQRGREDAAKIAETIETPEEGEYWIANRIATAIRTQRDKG